MGPALPGSPSSDELLLPEPPAPEVADVQSVPLPVPETAAPPAARPETYALPPLPPGAVNAPKLDGLPSMPFPVPKAAPPFPTVT